MSRLTVKSHTIFASATFGVPAIWILALCMLAMPAFAQTEPSGENDGASIETTIDLTKLVPLAEPADNASLLVSEDKAAEQTAGQNQQTAGTDTVIDEIVAELDETQPEQPGLNQGGASDDIASNDAGNSGKNTGQSSQADSDADATIFGQIKTSDNDTSNLVSNEEAVDLTELANTAPAIDEDNQSQTALETDDNVSASTGEAEDNTGPETVETVANTQPTARIGRRELSNIGLVSIGLADPNPTGQQLNSLIWQESDADDIAELVTITPAYGPSAEMNRLLLSALLRQAVPPQGAAKIADSMVDARLSWLAEAGQSDALAQLIRKLPDDEAWKEWRRWLVEYDLLTSNDAEACRQVELAVGDTLEPFWHQAQVVCQILLGDNLLAGFTADIVQASGLADPEFSQLVDVLLGRRDEVDLDDSALKPLHLVMMDAAHLEISQTQLAALPASLLQTRMSLRYVQRDAQLSSGFQSLAMGLSTRDQMTGLLRALYQPEQSIIQAAAGIGAEDSALNSLVRSNLYAQLSGALNSGTDNNDFDMLLAEAIRFEVELGQADLLMPLYASMMAQRLAAENLPEVDVELRSDFAVWSAIAAPDQPLDSVLLAAYPDADHYRALLGTSLENWTVDMLANIDGWDWLPLLQARGIQAPEIDYSSVVTGLEPLRISGGEQIHPLHIGALQQAASEQKVGEAILLAANALKGHRLEQIRATDLAQILAIFSSMGLDESARRIAGEALQARMLSGYFGMNHQGAVR